MNMIRIIAAAALAALAAHSASAPAQVAGPGRVWVAVCNSLAFEDTKHGIPRLVSAREALDREFRPDFDAVLELGARLQALQTAMVRNERDLSASSPLSAERKVLETSYSSQAEEYGKLGREFKFRQDDAKARYERRAQVMLGPIRLDIGKALGDYADARGIALILDPGKMGDMVMAVGERIDVTNGFIAFYNARPATAAGR